MPGRVHEARVNDDESIDVGWFAPDQLPLRLGPWRARRLADAREGGLAPRFHQPSPADGSDAPS